MPTLVRKIIYRGTLEELEKQMRRSLKDGNYPSWLTDITVETVVAESDVPGLTGQNPDGWWPDQSPR